jgi:adenylate cyclase
VLIADAHGYCRLMAADEALGYATFVAHRRIMQGVADAHGGHAVGGAGDSLLVEFQSVERAMQAAVAMQDRLSRANQQLSSQHRLEFRIGVNLGDVLDDGEDLHGHSVNVAARLQTLAAPGGIEVSAAVHEQVRNRLSVALRDGGWRWVKNIADPLRVFHIDAPGARSAARYARWSIMVRRALDSAVAALVSVLMLTM